MLDTHRWSNNIVQGRKQRVHSCLLCLVATKTMSPGTESIVELDTSVMSFSRHREQISEERLRARELGIKNTRCSNALETENETMRHRADIGRAFIRLLECGE